MLTRLAAAATLIASAAAAQDLGHWEQRAPFPLAATEVSAAAIGDKIYVVCGITPDNLRSNRLFVYDTVTDAWAERARIPIALGADHCNLAASGGKLYLLGAIRIGRGFLTNRTYEYDPATDQWSEVGRMDIPRAASAVGVMGHLIYVAGGEAAQDSGTAFAVFNTQTGRWAGLPKLPETRTHLAGGVVNGKFYAIGGRIGRINTVRGDVFEYDPATNQWTRKAPMPTPRGGIAAAVVNGRILVFGGEGPSGRPEATYEEVEEYDPTTDTWRALAPMPTPRHGFYGAATGDGRVFLPGGGPRAGGSFSQAHEVFHVTPPDPPLFSADAVLSAASFQPKLAPGSIAAVFGRDLSQGSARATAFPLPTSLNAVEVSVGGAPAAMLFAGPGQVNFVVPFVAPAEVAVTVRNAGVSSPPAMLTLAPAAPALFSLDQSGSGPGAVLLAGTGRLAEGVQPGDVLEIFCAGLGAVDQPLPDGVPAPLDRLVHALLQPTVTIGGVRAEVLFAGLTPGLAGVYQINVRVPEGVGSGTVQVEADSNGAVSNRVTITVP